MVPFHLVGIQVALGIIEVELAIGPSVLIEFLSLILNTGIVDPVLIVEKREAEFVIVERLISEVHHGRPIDDAEGARISIEAFLLCALLIATLNAVLVGRIVVLVTSAGEVPERPSKQIGCAAACHREIVIQWRRFVVRREFGRP